MEEQVILRRWTGKVPTERAQEYAKYMADTGFEEIARHYTGARRSVLAASTVCTLLRHQVLHRLSRPGTCGHHDDLSYSEFPLIVTRSDRRYRGVPLGGRLRTITWRS